MSLVHNQRRRRSETSDRFLSREASLEALEKIVRLSPGAWDISLHVYSSWSGNVRWARNEIISAGDITNPRLTISARHRDRSASFRINRLDEASIRYAIDAIQRRMDHDPPMDTLEGLSGFESYDEPDLWSDSTYDIDAVQRAALQQKVIKPAVAEGLLSAGYLSTSGYGHGIVNTEGLFAYLPETRARFSITVRDPAGTGSGWAGSMSKDWSEIDAEQLAEIATQKCVQSVDPVAIEPGRYTVILEPQAVSDLMLPLVRSLSRSPAENGIGPWADRSDESAPTGIMVGDPGAFGGEESVGGGGGGNSKIGQMVLDPRITISADPADPEAPFVPFSSSGMPYRRVRWIEDGVLRELAYSRPYATRWLNKPDPLMNSYAFRMSGGTSSIEEMIARTERGLLVTRFVNVRVVDRESLLCTGTTSDGMWLIERGEITKPVKNFRFRESPLYAFNSLEALGEPVRAFQSQPAIVPPAMIHDFSMTSLADAV